LVFAALVPLAAYAQQALTCARGQCVQVFRGAARVGPQLRVTAYGPVTLEGGVGSELVYTAQVTVRAADENEARRILAGFAVRAISEGGWSVLSAPAGFAAALALRAPKLGAASIGTSDGPVEANGIDGSLEVDSGAGPLAADRIRGACRLNTRGGDIRAGDIGGTLRATTGAGAITVRSSGGESVLRTMGGDIVVGNAVGPVRAETGAGTVRIEQAGGAVAATTGGGQIWIGSAKGMVTASNVAGMIHVGSAAGVTCNSGAGGVSLGNISGAIQVTTLMGSITSLLGAMASDSYLATGSGDITVSIPSNVSVTILAENGMADSPRRIVSEFPEVPVLRRGTRLVAQGAVNGGGPVLRISAGIGTIFIRRQR
jgi:DUF4097 and DUF4098 domain-containing protein YvlB